MFANEAKQILKKTKEKFAKNIKKAFPRTSTSNKQIEEFNRIIDSTVDQISSVSSDLPIKSYIRDLLTTCTITSDNKIQDIMDLKKYITLIRRADQALLESLLPFTINDKDPNSHIADMVLYTTDDIVTNIKNAANKLREIPQEEPIDLSLDKVNEDINELIKYVQSISDRVTSSRRPHPDNKCNSVNKSKPEQGRLAELTKEAQRLILKIANDKFIESTSLYLGSGDVKELIEENIRVYKLALVIKTLEEAGHCIEAPIPTTRNTDGELSLESIKDTVRYILQYTPGFVSVLMDLFNKTQEAGIEKTKKELDKTNEESIKKEKEETNNKIKELVAAIKKVELAREVCYDDLGWERNKFGILTNKSCRAIAIHALVNNVQWVNKILSQAKNQCLHANDKYIKSGRGENFIGTLPKCKNFKGKSIHYKERVEELAAALKVIESIGYRYTNCFSGVNYSTKHSEAGGISDRGLKDVAKYIIDKNFENKRRELVQKAGEIRKHNIKSTQEWEQYLRNSEAGKMSISNPLPSMLEDFLCKRKLHKAADQTYAKCTETLSGGIKGTGPVLEEYSIKDVKGLEPIIEYLKVKDGKEFNETISTTSKAKAVKTISSMVSSMYKTNTVLELLVNRGVIRTVYDEINPYDSLATLILDKGEFNSFFRAWCDFGGFFGKDALGKYTISYTTTSVNRVAEQLKQIEKYVKVNHDGFNIPNDDTRLVNLAKALLVEEWNIENILKVEIKNSYMKYVIPATKIINSQLEPVILEMTKNICNNNVDIKERELLASAVSGLMTAIQLHDKERYRYLLDSNLLKYLDLSKVEIDEIIFVSNEGLASKFVKVVEQLISDNKIKVMKRNFTDILFLEEVRERKGFVYNINYDLTKPGIIFKTDHYIAVSIIDPVYSDTNTEGFMGNFIKDNG